MSSQQFNFPPPPPPPQQPPQASPTYNPHAGTSNGRGVSTRWRANRGGRGYQGRGRGHGNIRSGSRGGGNITGYQGGNGYALSGEGYAPLTSNHGSGYPLPEYPIVQQPQLHSQPHLQPQQLQSQPQLQPPQPQSQPPTNFNTGYSQHPPRYSPAVVAPPNDRTNYDNRQRPSQYFNGNLPHASYSDNTQNYSTSYNTHDARHYATGPPRQEPLNQTMVLGPPIRMGFQGYQQASIITQPFSPPIPNGPPLPRHGSHVGARPSFRQPQTNTYSQHNSTNTFQGHRSRGQKRGHQDAFSNPQSSIKPTNKTQVAPSVPSFGIPLPVKPPAPVETGRKRKKKRRHNQLGLTPKTVEHESSEEEGNDVDEEAKLAVAAGIIISENQLQFTYKGQKSTLQSASDIASWIEERKKRFPTKARIAEKAERSRRQREEYQAANRDRESMARQKAEAKEKEKADAKAKRKVDRRANEETDAKTRKDPELDKYSEKTTLTPNDAAEKAKLKIEKLRRQLEKEEKRAARAAAKVTKLKAEASRYEGVNQVKVSSPFRHKTEEDESVQPTEIPSLNQPSGIKCTLAVTPKEENIEQIGNTNAETTLPSTKHTNGADAALKSSPKIPDPLTPTSQPSIQRIPESDQQPEPDAAATTSVGESPEMLRTSQDDLGSLVVPTNPQKLDDVVIGSSFSVSSPSSSASSLTISEDEATSSDDSSSSSSSSSAPESRPSRRVQPDKVAPPKRARKNAVCRSFLHHGRCKKGDACNFRHELPNRGSYAERNNRRTTKRFPGEEMRVRIGLYQRLVEQEKAQEALQSRKAVAERGESRPLDEAVKLAVPTMDEVAAS